MRTKRRRRTSLAAPLCLLIAAHALSACAGFDTQRYSTFVADPSARAGIDFHGLTLSSGQIVVGEQGTAAGFLLSLFTQDFIPFGHSGVLVIEDGEPFVYEALATLRPRLRGPPTNALRGRIYRTPLVKFLARQRIAAIYEPAAGVAAERVVSYAVAQFRLRTPFDAHFDSADHARLFCSEFVALALEAGGAPPILPTPRSSNASLRVALDWLEIESAAFVMPGAALPSSHRVALLSRALSPGQVAAHFEIRRELHRRFTPDQTLGNVLRWSLGRPVFQARVASFIDETLENYRGRDGDSAAQVRADVQRHAGDVFGPFEIAALDDGLDLAAGQGQR